MDAVPAPRASCRKRFRQASYTGGLRPWLRLASCSAAPSHPPVPQRHPRAAPQAPLKRGDGVVFDAGAPEQPEQGGALFDVLAADGRPLPAPAGPAPPPHAAARRPGGAAAARAPERGCTGATGATEVQLLFGAGCLDAARVAPGSLVWRSSDPALEARSSQGVRACPRCVFHLARPRHARRRAWLDSAPALKARSLQHSCDIGHEFCTRPARRPAALAAEQQRSAAGAGR